MKSTNRSIHALSWPKNSGMIGKRGVDSGDNVAKFRDVSFDQLNP